MNAEQKHRIRPNQKLRLVVPRDARELIGVNGFPDHTVVTFLHHDVLDGGREYAMVLFPDGRTKAILYTWIAELLPHVYYDWVERMIGILQNDSR